MSTRRNIIKLLCARRRKTNRIRQTHCKHLIMYEHCEKCRLFRCNICEELVSWNYGCDDNMPGACDSCWDAADKKKSA